MSECGLNEGCALIQCIREDSAYSTLIRMGFKFIARTDGHTGSSGLSKWLHPHNSVRTCVVPACFHTVMDCGQVDEQKRCKGG